MIKPDPPVVKKNITHSLWFVIHLGLISFTTLLIVISILGY